MSFTKIRPFDYSDADYHLMGDFCKFCWPQHGDSIKETIIEDGIYAEFECHRFFYFQGQTAVAFGEMRVSLWSKQKGSYSIILVVDPAWRRKGIGQAVYNHLLSIPVKTPVQSLEVGTTTLESDGQSFASRNGFVLGTREIVSRLELRKKGAVFRDIISREEKDFDFVAWPDVKEKGFTERDIHAIYSAVDADVPWHEEHAPEDFEKWEIRSKKEDHHLYEHNYFAIDQDRLIGLTMLLSRKGIEDAYMTGLTGVLKEFRRMGIARRLKALSLRSVIEQKPHIKFIWTENEEDNPMYALNRQLGFERQYDLLFYQKIFS